MEFSEPRAFQKRVRALSNTHTHKPIGCGYRLGNSMTGSERLEAINHCMRKDLPQSKVLGYGESAELLNSQQAMSQSSARHQDGQL